MKGTRAASKARLLDALSVSQGIGLTRRELCKAAGLKKTPYSLELIEELVLDGRIRPTSEKFKGKVQFRYHMIPNYDAHASNIMQRIFFGTMHQESTN